MSKRAWFFIFVSVLAGLNLAAVRKAEDPIRDTQTNPILYQQKMEEEKDGKKGPLLYSVKHNPHDNFFSDPPYQTAKDAPVKKAAIEESVAPDETAGWWEEQPSDLQPVSADEKWAEPAGEEKASEDSAVSDQSVKGDDYWW